MPSSIPLSEAPLQPPSSELVRSFYERSLAAQRKRERGELKSVVPTHAGQVFRDAISRSDASLEAIAQDSRLGPQDRAALERREYAWRETLASAQFVYEKGGRVVLSAPMRYLAQGFYLLRDRRP